MAQEASLTGFGDRVSSTHIGILCSCSSSQSDLFLIDGIVLLAIQRGIHLCTE